MSSERILVVDDSQQIVTHLAEQVLPTFGFKTLYALDGRTGLDLIRREKPDLVMLDLNLPEMTGLDVLQRMVEESITTPVVLMTGYGSEKSAVDAFRLGAKDYIIKPFSVDEVLETINRALLETRLRNEKQQLAEQLRRAHVEMRRRVNEMSTLFGIGKVVASLLSVNKVLDRVLEAAIYLSNAEESTIWLMEQGSNQLRAYAKKGSREMEPQMQELSSQDSPVGQVMRSGRALRESAFSGRGITLKTGYTARAVLYVPMVLRGQPMGVLSVSNRTEPRAFSERDEFLLSALADYAAIALENARVFQATDRALAEGNEELHTLIQITRTITSSLDLGEVVRLTIKQVHDSWQIEASSLWLLDQQSQTLSILANVGTPADVLARFKVPLGQGFVGHVAQAGEWIYSNDVENHPLHFRAVDRETGFKTRSLLCVPLVFRDKVIGVLELLNKLDGDFSDRDVEKALSIATAVAIGVTNSLLFKESESRQQQLEATLEHNGNPIIITDQHNCLLLLNQQARQRLGLTKGAIGKPAAEVIALEHLAGFLTQPLEINGARRIEVTLPDDSVWLSTLAPIPNYGRILILQDITYLKELDRAKSNFVATVSHDLRAPLNSISGFATMLQQIGPLNDEQKLYTNRIIQSTNRMMDLVNGLLDLAKVNARLEQARHLCDVAEIAMEAVADLQGQALTKDISLEVDVAENVGPVQGDATLLRQAISNLVDNAIKYSPAGKSVKIDVTSQDATVLVKVKDMGMGISPDDLPFIFDKFYRSKDSSNVEDGIGLGLTLVRSIAEAHDGQVWVESQEGLGSTFALRLPLARTNSQELLQS
ncbi:MAG: GAF domain-containing protein [Chloroflexi bacterium]|nr:GAF domain-containing protein [Chloroflexota bacterium]MCI0578532.1 GAF domain-containing protein [Chloroflexota bacterium]MCI0649178.1 GAF domain-containing protein [Chloroflexota bacterium]MCI0725331.1 GAF domain-containing protein [Chloroflexota bacterium]